MKKVLIVSTVGLIYDGITSVIVSCLEAMQLSGLDVYVVGTIEIKNSIRKRIENTGCTIVELPNRRTDTWRYFWALKKFIKKNRIEVIHAHGNSGTMAIEMMAAFFGGCKKRIAHSHNTRCDQVKVDKVLRPIFNKLYTDALACGEEAGKWLFGKRYFEVLTNGRDVSKYCYDEKKRNEIRAKYNLRKELVIGHVGGFFEQKNHTFLVDVYKELKIIRPDCRLFMIGDGPLREEIEKKCKGLDVIFTGTIDNVNDYLNAMDGMLLPSLFEGLPLVAIEWQINGLPAVLSDCITKECKVTDGIEFVSLELSAHEWANEILKLISEFDRYTNSQIAQVYMNSSIYNINVSAQKLERIYRG